MNFTEPLNRILGQLSKIKILRYLIRADVAMNGREIAQAVGLSHVKCHTALKELSEQGFISVRQVGRSNLYELQSGHIIIRDWLRPLFRKEEEMKKRLAEIVVRRLSVKPESLIIFGSIAKEKERPDSDIDLLCVVSGRQELKKCEKELAEVGEEITRLFGNRLAPQIITKKSLLGKSKRGDRFINLVTGSGEVIYGKTIAEMMSDAAR